MDINYREDYNHLSLEDKMIAKSLKETLFVANKLKQQTEELNKSLSFKNYLTRIFNKWKK